jgi:uncharacterized Fe-S center protein
MKNSKVYFASMRATSQHEGPLKKVAKLCDQLNFSRLFLPNELVAVKLHFGEKGNTGFIQPIFVREVVDKIKAAGGKPFLTDTNTLYTGSRANSVDHLHTAIANGFAYAVVNAPLIIADGLHGKNYVEVEINKKHFQKVKIGSDLYHADSLLCLSHVKGHMMTGFGGALKNLAMGGASRAGKRQQHSSLLPEIGPKCTGCKICHQWCPADAILSNREGKAAINPEKCIGCGECTVTCPHRVIKIQWQETTSNVQERIAEYSYGLLKNKTNKTAYINFVMNVTPDCDCNSWSDVAIVSDVGILAAFDPVAVDQASVDLINAQLGKRDSALKKNFAAGEDKFRGIHTEIDWTVQLRSAEQLGIGTRNYELIEI